MSLTVGKSLMGLGMMGLAAHSFKKGADTGGQLTNAFFESTLGSADIDNTTLGENIGFMTEPNAITLAARTSAMKWTGGVGGGLIGAAIGVSPGAFMMKKAKNPLWKAFGGGLALAGVGLGSSSGFVGGYVGGSMVPLRRYMNGPIGREYMARGSSTGYYQKNKMPVVSGDVVFGAYNQRHA